MSLVIQSDLTPLTVDHEGVARVGGTRVTLDALVTAFQEGASPEAMALSFSSLDLGTIYAVIAYYLRHRAQVDDYLAARGTKAAETRREAERRGGTPGIRQRLLARRPQRG